MTPAKEQTTTTKKTKQQLKEAVQSSKRTKKRSTRTSRKAAGKKGEKPSKKSENTKIKENSKVLLSATQLNNMKNLLTGSNNKKPNHSIHQQMITNAMDNLSVNVDMIDDLSKTYDKVSAWNDIRKVGEKLKELSTQLSRASNPSLRKRISVLISTYEVQNKKLIKEKAEKDAKERIMKNSSNPAATYSLNEKDELIAKQEDDDASLMSGIDITSNKNIAEVKEPKESATTPKRKIVNTKENNVNSPTKQQKTHDAKSFWEKAKKNSDKCKSRDPPADKESIERKTPTDQHYIRIRMQFVGEGKSTTTYQDQLRTLIYDTMQCAKAIDPQAALYPWKNESSLKVINGNEAKLMSKEILEKYIDIPVKIERKMIDGRMYYRNGLKIKTKCDVDTFVDLWNNKKYENNKESPFKKWKSVKRAEMQNFSRGYSIGYFVGTVERGDYSTINKALQEEFGKAVEVSFQTVEQKGVTPKVWSYARDMAEKKYENIYSKEYKREKFMHSPSGLVVYVGEKSLVKLTKRKISLKYGILENNQWPKMKDGSRMRFIPILPGEVKNKKTHQNLFDHLMVQSISKAYDMKMDLKVWDIHTKKDYLGNKTLEQVIHEVESKDKKGIPLFKHIVKKWSQDPSKENWEVAISPSMYDEAAEYLKKLHFTLKQKYTLKVNTHLRNPEKSDDYNPMYYVPIKKRDDDYDKEIEDFILSMGNTDPYAKILIEGMELIEEKEEKKPVDMLINTPSFEEALEKAMDKLDSNEKEKTGDDVVMTDVAKNEPNTEVKQVSQEEDIDNNNQDDENITTWEEMSLGGEVVDFVNATESEIRKIKTTIGRKRITSEEIQTWKNVHWNEYETMLEKVERKEYEIMKIIVNSILEERIENEDSERENNILSNLIGFSENIEKSENLQALHAIPEEQTINNAGERETKGIGDNIPSNN